MADSTLDGNTKIRLAQLLTVLTGVVAMTTLLVGMRHELAQLNKTMPEVLEWLKGHESRIDHLEWKTGGK